MFRNLQHRALVVATLAMGAAGSALATPTTDYDGIVAAVDWSDVILAITGIAALLAGVLVVRKGVRFALGMLR